MLLLMLLLVTDRYQPADVPASVVDQLTHATQTMSAGDLAGAADELERIISANPNYFLAHYELGFVYQEMGRLDESARELGRAKELNDSLKLGEPSVDASLGWIRYLQHDYSAARSLTKSSLLAPAFLKLDVRDRQRFYKNLGSIYTAMRRPCHAQLYHELATSKSGGGVPGTASELAGSWVLVRWEQPPSLGILGQRTSDVEGVLKIEPGSNGASYSGVLTMCVAQHSTDPVVEEFAISETGSHVSLVGNVTQRSDLWSNDRLAVTVDGSQMTGTDSEWDRVAFTRVL